MQIPRAKPLEFLLRLDSQGRRVDLWRVEILAFEVAAARRTAVKSQLPRQGSFFFIFKTINFKNNNFFKFLGKIINNCFTRWTIVKDSRQGKRIRCFWSTSFFVGFKLIHLFI